MAVQEDGFATRATTSCTSSARRLGGSPEMVQKIGKPAVFLYVYVDDQYEANNEKEKQKSRPALGSLKSVRLVQYW